MLAFVSSFGQTWFIGLFKDSILDEYGLSHTSYGSMYAGATLASAACLGYLGRKIDSVDLRWFTSMVCVGLVVACFTMSIAASPLVLFCALLMLRLFGQGLSSHVSNVAAARYFDKERGRALSITSLGHPAGEALLPVSIVAFLAVVDTWRTGWQASGLVVLAVVLPGTLLLLRGHGSRHAAVMDGVSEQHGSHTQRQWTATEVLKDGGFYLVLPIVLAPPFIGTGLMFHQDVLRAQLSWSKELFATGFVVFSFLQASVAPFAGMLVDRYSAQRILPIYMIPYGAVLLACAHFIGDGMVFVLMGGLGLSSGFGVSVVGAMWAERYGVRHLGAIRSQVAVVMVMSTALAPPILGWMIDADVSMQAILTILTGYVAAASVLAIRRRPRSPID